MNPNTRICMTRDDLDDFPRYDLPDGHALRTYRPGDEETWVAIHQDADTLQDVTARTFERNFGDDRAALADRCFFLVAPGGRDIGTGTAWYDRAFRGGGYGRVHWICILRDWQGRGLAKPLMSAVLDRLARSHDRAFLTTAPGRPRAVHLYLRFGFRPCVESAEEREAWRLVARTLDHPALDEFRGASSGVSGMPHE
ncbi:MAG: GNAT family N-acetyltransferase [Planctomycetota bacterium]